MSQNYTIAGRDRIIVSIAQFRPEKNHTLQLKAFSLYKNHRSSRNVKLVMMGSVRGPEDELLLEELKQLRSELNLSEVQFNI